MSVTEALRNIFLTAAVFLRNMLTTMISSRKWRSKQTGADRCCFLSVFSRLILITWYSCSSLGVLLQTSVELFCSYTTDRYSDPSLCCFAPKITETATLVISNNTFTGLKFLVICWFHSDAIFDSWHQTILHPNNSKEIMSAYYSSFTVTLSLKIAAFLVIVV